MFNIVLVQRADCISLFQNEKAYYSPDVDEKIIIKSKLAETVPK